MWRFYAYFSLKHKCADNTTLLTLQIWTSCLLDMENQPESIQDTPPPSFILSVSTSQIGQNAILSIYTTLVPSNSSSDISDIDISIALLRIKVLVLLIFCLILSLVLFLQSYYFFCGLVLSSVYVKSFFHLKEEMMILELNKMWNLAIGEARGWLSMGV